MRKTRSLPPEKTKSDRSQTRKSLAGLGLRPPGGSSKTRGKDENWPPKHGLAYAQSTTFGELLMELVEGQARKYPNIDFTDAVASIYEWFDSRLTREPKFLNSRRFPTPAAFRAYLRQAVWNAGRLAERKRRNKLPLESLPWDQPILDTELEPPDQAFLLELIDSLKEPTKTVFSSYFFEELKEEEIADLTGLDVTRVRQIYEEAVDAIAMKASKSTRRVGRKKRHM